MTFTHPTTFDPSHRYCGPNDGAYKALKLEAAARHLREAIEFHVGYSHHASVTLKHPLVIAMRLLAEEHRACVAGDNRGHDPELFHIPDVSFITPEVFWKRDAESLLNRPPYTLLCEFCARGITHYSLGLVAHPRACTGTFRHPPPCGNPAVYIFPYIPPVPGCDAVLNQHPDGTLHWDGDNGLRGEVGPIGDSGPATH